MSKLTFERVRELFDYDNITGNLIRKIRLSKRTHVGESIGYIGNHGYLAASVDKSQYLVHRLVFLWFYGRWPESQIDHINHVRTDNRIDNLREVNHRENGINQKLSTNNTSGTNGVYWNKQLKKWQAHITIHGKLQYLGVFEDINDATSARDKADIRYNFHENHGSI